MPSSFEQLESRRHFSGSPVSGFGTGGYEYVAATNDVTRTAVQADGKILVLTENPQGGIVLTRLKSNGHVDATFNGGHTVLKDDNAGLSMLAGVAAERDGSIVVVYANSSYATFEKLRTDGRRDTRFGKNGFYFYNPGDGFSVDGQLAVDATGNLYVTGTLDDNYDSRVILAVTPSGTLDSTFGGTNNPGLAYNFENIDVASDGKLYAGNASAVYRLNADASVDPTFGKAGRVRDATNPNSIQTFAVDQTGNVYLGEDDFGATEVAKFSSKGNPITTFGVNGITVLDGLASQILPQPAGGVAASVAIGARHSIQFILSTGKYDIAIGTAGLDDFPSEDHSSLYDSPQLTLVNSTTLLVSTTNSVDTSGLYHKHGTTTVAELTLS